MGDSLKLQRSSPCVLALRAAHRIQRRIQKNSTLDEPPRPVRCAEFADVVMDDDRSRLTANNCVGFTSHSDLAVGEIVRPVLQPFRTVQSGDGYSTRTRYFTSGGNCHGLNGREDGLH